MTNLDQIAKGNNANIHHQHEYPAQGEISEI